MLLDYLQQDRVASDEAPWTAATAAARSAASTSGRDLAQSLRRHKEQQGNFNDDLSPQVICLVDNGSLQSHSKGVRYRRSPCLQDIDKSTPSAPFGSLVTGIPLDGEWLQVGALFLPFRLQGAKILLEQDFSNSDNSTRTASTIEAKNLKPPATWQGTLDRVQEIHGLPPFEIGSGLMYEVVSDRVAIRASPSTEAPIQGSEFRGAVVELFEWDATRRWRRVQRPADQEYKSSNPQSWTLGWMLLDHEGYGPLLRPHDLPFQQDPLIPLHVAVHEENLLDIQLFLLDGIDVDAREVDGRTALMAAVEGNRRDSCILLLQARADPTLISPQGGSVMDYANDKATRVLLQGLDSRSTAPSDLDWTDALERLLPETRIVATRLRAESEEHRQARQAEEAEAAAEQLREMRRHREEEALREKTAQEVAALQVRARLESERLIKEHEDWKASVGELCEVLSPNGVEVRTSPNDEAELVGHECYGQIVQLHEFSDETHVWRRAVGHDFEGTLSGWLRVKDANNKQVVISCDDEQSDLMH